MHISEQVKTRKKHPILRVLLILLVIAVIEAAGLCYWQKENLKAVIDSRTYTTDELTDKIAESKHEAEQVIAEYDTPIMRDFTLEEEDKIRKGELTPEEAMQLIMTPETGTASETEAASETGKSESTGGSVQSSAPSQAKPENPANSIVANYLQQVYGLKAYYLGELGRVESEMRSVYVNSGKDKSAIPGIIQSYLPEVGSLESECDSQISSLLNSMRSELSAIGADTSVADKIYNAYLNEKSLKKSYYLSMY